MAREVSVAGLAADCGARSVTSSGERPIGDGPAPVKDDGLRRVLTWTLIALVVSLLMTLVGVTLAIRWFDRP
jgi:predicted secreted protein